MARALIHVDTLPRRWITVLSSRTERETGKRRIHAHARSRLLSLCCRFCILLLLLLLLLLQCCCCCYCCCYCCCCCSDCFISTALLYCCTSTWYIFFQLLLLQQYRQLFGFCSVGCWEVELRDLSLYQVCVRGPACVHTKGGRRASCDTLCCCGSLLLLAAVVAGKQHQQKQQVALNNITVFFFSVVHRILYVLYDTISYLVQKAKIQSGFRHISLFFKWFILRSTNTLLYVAHQGGLVLWYQLRRPEITSKYVVGLFSFCLDGVSYSGRSWDGKEGREPFPSRCHCDSGINKAPSPLLLSYSKVSNTKDMLNRQTCQEILLCLHIVTYVLVRPWKAGNYLRNR